MFHYLYSGHDFPPPVDCVILSGVSHRFNQGCSTPGTKLQAEKSSPI
jgi:hypothetical protein